MTAKENFLGYFLNSNDAWGQNNLAFGVNTMPAESLAMYASADMVLTV